MFKVGQRVLFRDDRTSPSRTNKGLYVDGRVYTILKITTYSNGKSEYTLVRNAEHIATENEIFPLVSEYVRLCSK